MKFNGKKINWYNRKDQKKQERGEEGKETETETETAKNSFKKIELNIIYFYSGTNTIDIIRYYELCDSS